MKPRPLEEAKNAGLRGSLSALKRAAQRAREIAASTGTLLVFGSNGRVEYRYAEPTPPPRNFVEEPKEATDSTHDDVRPA